MSLKNIFLRNLTYFIPVIIILLTGILFLLLFDKAEIHLVLNAWYSPFFDSFFRYATYLGDGLIFPIVAVLLAFVRWRYFLSFVLCGILVLLCTAILKQGVFHGMPRPVSFFEHKADLRLVEGVEMARQNSFPSGHTTTAFAALGFLALMVNLRWAQLLFFAGAVIAGYSRIYLSQHFLVDVVAGGILGTFIAIFSFYLAQRLQFSWADKSLTSKRNTG